MDEVYEELALEVSRRPRQSRFLIAIAAQLSQMPDPELAHKRRGAPFTFAPELLASLVNRLKEQPSVITKAPSFNHALKDPKEDDITILPSHKIILFEGLYLQLSLPVWADIAHAMDELWFLDCDVGVARERVAQRHLASGLVSTVKAGYERFDSNDGPNGEFILANSVKPTKVIKSINT
ncbi:hypothetical protein SmJEL517_g02895 [Synchytrium microbalum]|uniref:Phosphoribulokinase/uridine kinase domain-containing protein n=1 Tax=Synchytrium microbalum TaxID=1806994 RepID=A0A507CAJ5_9FUNG|nr:uncharacterized protein SmJEL517_g02895 [Synchytrium microbalum]TPX34535.1 hypothetical protein SmJEL517_g02895 [Synchytrium microbalum]